MLFYDFNNNGCSYTASLVTDACFGSVECNGATVSVASVSLMLPNPTFTLPDMQPKPTTMCFIYATKRYDTGLYLATSTTT